MSKEKRRVPKLRFPGFTEDWEQRKLSELATMNARIGWQNLRTSEFLDSGDYLLITGTDFDNGRIKYGTCHYVEKKRFDQDTKIQLSTGSILITKDGTLGKVALVEELPKPATLNAGVFNVRVKDDAVLSYKYLYHYLKAPFLMKYVTANATGGTIKHLNQSILVDFPIPITEKLEQDRIAKLLDSLELSITLHQRKLEHLNLKKKALLQKLFPKDGERYPELRFPGFTDAWEQRKLGAMCSLFIDGDWIESKDQSNEGIRLIQTGNIGVGKFIDKPENKKWISHSTFNNLRCKELLDGDILISRLPQPAGRACIVNTNNEKWITAVDCTIVRLLDQYSNKFILQSLCTYNYFHLIDSFLAGGTRQRVSRSNLSDINIMSPKKIEQDKIGLFFEYVDNLITLHQRKLEDLQLQKKALLQQMFV